MRISASRVGYRVDAAKALAALSSALLAGRRVVPMVVYTVAPSVNEGYFGKSIVVDRGQRHLYLRPRRFSLGRELGRFTHVRRRVLVSGVEGGSKCVSFASSR